MKRTKRTMKEKMAEERVKTRKHFQWRCQAVIDKHDELEDMWQDMLDEHIKKYGILI